MDIPDPIPIRHGPQTPQSPNVPKSKIHLPSHLSYRCLHNREHECHPYQAPCHSRPCPFLVRPRSVMFTHGKRIGDGRSSSLIVSSVGRMGQGERGTRVGQWWWSLLHVIIACCGKERMERRRHIPRGGILAIGQPIVQSANQPGNAPIITIIIEQLSRNVPPNLLCGTNVGSDPPVPIFAEAVIYLHALVAELKVGVPGIGEEHVEREDHEEFH
mmetsp:Transcript_20439/g.42860  ORF Transcript_20439/g.42860 Transcript_20439/m.42860 type:complete len:215 (-) Transcript_20439:425-1069(-)